MPPNSSQTKTALTQFRLASTAGHEDLFQLILDPDLDFISLLLQHPKLDDCHLLALLKRRDLSEELISAIYQSRKRQLSHNLLVALVKNRSIPGTLIRTLLTQLRLFELSDLCKQPGVTPDQKFAAERTILQRLPITPLGNKITLARKGTTTIVSELLKEGHPQIVEVCLNNPHLNEAALFQFLRSAKANAETISQIARHNRWKERPNLKLAILKNRKTPDIWFTLWLPKLSTQVIKQLQLTHKTTPRLKRLINSEIHRRHSCH